MPYSHYIARARQLRPTVPAEVSAYVVDAYVRLRKQHKDRESQNKSHTYTSARTLLGILRLSQALARLRFGETVIHEDVDEALRIMEKSKESLDNDDGRDGEREMDQSNATKIYRLIKDMAATHGGGAGRARRNGRGRKLGKGPGGERDEGMDVDSDDDEDELSELSLVDIRQRVLAAGFTETQLMETVIEVRSLSAFYRRNPLLTKPSPITV